MSVVLNSTVQHIALSEDTSEAESNNEIDPNPHQPSSSIICHIIPVILLKVTSSIVHSALQLAYPLYAISHYPNNSTTIAGLIFGAQGVGILSSSIFVGRFISKTSDEFCILIAIIIRTLSIVLIAIFDTHLSAWIFTAFCIGFSGLGAISISVNHILAKHIKTKQRGKISSMIAGLSRFGRAIGPLYVGFIDDTRIYLLISAVISFASFLIVCCVMLPPNITINSVESPGSYKHFKEGWQQTKCSKLSIPNWLSPQNKKSQNIGLCYVWYKYGKILLFYGLFGFGIKWSRQTRKMILTFRGDELSLSNAEIGSINSVSFVLDSVCFVFAGYLMDRYGRKINAVLGLFLFAVALIAINFVSDFETLLVIAIIFGLGDGVTVGLMMTSTADLAPKECKSEFISAFKLFVNLPRVIAPIIIGTLCNEVSLLSAALLSAVIALIVMLWVAFVLEDTSAHSIKNSQNGATLIENKHVEMSDSESIQPNLRS